MKKLIVFMKRNVFFVFFIVILAFGMLGIFSFLSVQAAPGYCAGCLFNERCIPYGIRALDASQALFCSEQGKMEAQQAVDSQCRYGYQCESNLCLQGKCQDVKKITDETSNFKILAVKGLCRMSNPFSNDNYIACVEKYGVEVGVLPVRDLTAEALSDSSIEVKWSNTVENADGYRLFRASNKEGPYVISITLSPETNNFVDVGLEGDTIYFYKVIAFNFTLGESFSFGIVNATTFSFAEFGNFGSFGITGNVISGEVPPSSVVVSAVCGNKIIELGEECDDGNTLNGDACTSSCLLNPTTQGPIASWSFNETEWKGSLGEVTNDATGIGGVSRGARIVKEGVGGSAAYFDGAESYLDLGAHQLLQLGEGSFSVWVKPALINVQPYHTVFSKRGIQSEYSLGVTDQGQKFDFRYNSGTNAGDSCEPFGIGSSEAGKWHNVAVTRDATGLTTFYVDGKRAGNSFGQTDRSKFGSLQCSVRGGFYTSVSTLFAGRQPLSFYQNSFKGKIDELQIYPRVLSASEIDSLYLQQNSTLVASYLQKLEVSAEGISPNVIVLSWQNSFFDINVFKVYRSLSAAGPFVFKANITDSFSSSYIGAGLVANTTYYYKLGVENIDGEYAESGIVNATTLSYSDIAPPAPSSVSASGVSSSSIQVNWGAAS